MYTTTTVWQRGFVQIKLFLTESIKTFFVCSVGRNVNVDEKEDVEVALDKVLSCYVNDAFSCNCI